MARNTTWQKHGAHIPQTTEKDVTTQGRSALLRRVIMNRRTGPANSDSLLADLSKISGLPLEELQFLGKAGLLRTQLRNIPVERYTLEEWKVGLAVLYDRRMEFASLEEVRP